MFSYCTSRAISEPIGPWTTVSLRFWHEERFSVFPNHNRWTCPCFCEDNDKGTRSTKTHTYQLMFWCTSCYFSLTLMLHLYFHKTKTHHTVAVFPGNSMLSSCCVVSLHKYAILCRITVLLLEGLFTSGIKSAYDIESSGWMELSQGAGTVGPYRFTKQKNWAFDKNQ